MTQRLEYVRLVNKAKKEGVKISLFSSMNQSGESKNLLANV